MKKEKRQLENPSRELVMKRAHVLTAFITDFMFNAPEDYHGALTINFRNGNVTNINENKSHLLPKIV